MYLRHKNVCIHNVYRVLILVTGQASHLPQLSELRIHVCSVAGLLTGHYSCPAAHTLTWPGTEVGAPPLIEASPGGGFLTALGGRRGHAGVDMDGCFWTVWAAVD